MPQQNKIKYIQDDSIYIEFKKGQNVNSII